ncbi:unnamed protein product [Triticum turgidum subsp. durum]|uniref:BHLH domain-containing protein n=1 Tax=Triticum turgidum subsp. durum TaxID=4567 RepID=A0A9R1BWE4_TRITD|nr:unnamed protein product [Triticum turgidum subsp. durum]
MAGGDGGGGGGAQDDFFDQMLSTLPSAWGDLGAGGKSPWEIAAGAEDLGAFDESTLPASRLRQHQIGGEKPVMLQLTDLQRQGLGGEESGGTGFSPLPLFADRSPPQSREEMDGGGAAPPRQTRVRARRGQATDPHSIAERLRRERIAERMKSLQELVPNANKTDKASMLDEIIDYVKFLQLQVKVLSMSRLGGAAGMAPLVASMSSEAKSSAKSSNGGGNSAAAAAAKANGGGESGGGAGAGGLRVTEHQVAKMMEEDMGTAMQYLQGKGLCLMPISLASAISSATTTTTSPASLLARQAVRPGAAAAALTSANGGGDDAPVRPVKVDAGAASGGKP